MASTGTKIIKELPGILNRHGWQLSDESDEDEGVIPPGDDLSSDDEDDEELEVGDDKFNEE